MWVIFRKKLFCQPSTSLLIEYALSKLTVVQLQKIQILGTGNRACIFFSFLFFFGWITRSYLNTKPSCLDYFQRSSCSFKTYGSSENNNYYGIYFLLPINLCYASSLEQNCWVCKNNLIIIVLSSLYDWPSPDRRTQLSISPL